MEKRERKFYSEEFKELALAAYYNNKEPISINAKRFALDIPETQI